MTKQKRVMEWDLLLQFSVVLVLWMFVGLPILNQVTIDYGTVMGFGLYILGWVIIGYYIGDAFERGWESALLAVNLMWTTDVISPPIVINYNVVPTQELLNIWGSDTFTYTLWAMLNLPHQATWILTYVLTPLVGFFLLIYMLSGKKLKNTIKTQFGG